MDMNGGKTSLLVLFSIRRIMKIGLIGFGKSAHRYNLPFIDQIKELEVVGYYKRSNKEFEMMHPNYKDINIRSVSLKNSDNVVYLKSNVSNLDEIVISKKRPEKTFQKIIENSKDKLTIPVRLQIYEREFFKLNGVYTYYNDGLLNFQIPDRDKLYDTNILVEQNRSFGILNDDVANDLLGYNLNNLIGNYYSFKYLNPLLDKKAAEHYNFTIFGTSKGDNYYVMKVQPVDEVKGLLDSYEILYDNKKDLIIEVSSSLSPERIANQPDNSKIGSDNIRSSYFKTIYKINDDNYVTVCNCLFKK